MLNIGLDIDNTMYHLDVIERVSDLLGLNYKSKDVKHWIYDKQEINNFPKYFTDIIFKYFDDSDYMSSLHTYLGTKSKISLWKKQGHKLYVISARRPSVQIKTIEMLNRDFGVGFFESIHFVEHRTDAKIKLYKELNIDITIDDNPVDLQKSCENGLKVYAINNEYTQYNSKKLNEIEHLYPNLIRVENIGEIEL